MLSFKKKIILYIKKYLNDKINDFLFIYQIIKFINNF